MSFDKDRIRRSVYGQLMENGLMYYKFINLPGLDMREMINFLPEDVRFLDTPLP